MTLVSNLLPSIVGHVVLGGLLAALVWSVGLGAVSLLRGRGLALPAPALLVAYPLGLLAVLVASFAFLLHRAGAAVAVVVLAAPLWALARDAEVLGELRAAVGRLVLPLPYVAAFAVTIGFYSYPPRAEVGSRVYGDALFYVTKLEAAEQSLLPMRDLNTLGENHFLLELAPTLTGASLARLGVVDGFLFHSATVSAFLLVSLAVGLGAVAARWGGPLSTPQVAVVGLLVAGSLAYPTWIAESPPVAFALPLAFPLWFLIHERLEFGAFALLAGVIGVDLIFTKILAAPAAVLLVAGALAVHHRGVVREHVPALAAAFAGLVAGAVALLLVTGSWTIEVIGSEGSVGSHLREAFTDFRDGVSQRSTGDVAPLLGLTGQLLLVAALVRLRAWWLAAAYGVTLALNWLGTVHNFEIGLALLALVAALRMATGDADRVAWLLAGAAGVVLAVASWFRDTGELRVGLLLVLLLGAAAVSAWWSGRERMPALAEPLALAGIVVAGGLLALSGRALLGGAVVATAAALVLWRPTRAVVAGAVAVSLLVGLAGSARAAQQDTFELGVYDTTILRPEYRDVWNRVADVAGDDALVFTSHTGPELAPERGWNYYPGLSGRQVYLAGWYSSSLRTDRDELERRLALNRDLLQGRRAPADVPGTGDFDEFYAVLWKNEPRPRSFTEVYANKLYVLYRVPAREAGPELVTQYACADFDECTRLPAPRPVE